MRKDMGLYRGKRRDNGEWVEGAYYKQTLYYGDPCEKHYIITSTESLDNDYNLEYYEVDPETVGEYTGVYDNTKWEDLTKEEKEKFYYENYSEDGKTIKYPNVESIKHLWKGKPIFEGDIVIRNDYPKFKHIVEYLEEYAGFYPLFDQDNGCGYGVRGDNCKVVGNRFDNPELLRNTLKINF